MRTLILVALLSAAVYGANDDVDDNLAQLTIELGGTVNVFPGSEREILAPTLRPAYTASNSWCQFA